MLKLPPDRNMLRKNVTCVLLKVLKTFKGDCFTVTDISAANQYFGIHSCSICDRLLIESLLNDVLISEGDPKKELFRFSDDMLILNQDLIFDQIAEETGHV